MLEVVHAEGDDLGQLQEYGALNMKKKIDPEGLEKGAIDTKKKRKINRLFPMGRYNWFYHTDMINLFYQNLTFPLGVNSCLDSFSRKNILHGLFFPFRF